MEKRVLVISSQPEFGELIRISLLESKEYSIELALSPVELIWINPGERFDLMIVDVDFDDPQWAETIGKIQTGQTDLKTVVFPIDQDRKTSIQQKIRVDLFCEKPFYVPDFLGELKTLLGSEGLQLEQPAGALQAALFTNNLKELRSSLNFAFNISAAQQIILFVNELAFASSGFLKDTINQEIGAFLKSQHETLRSTDLLYHEVFSGDTNRYLLHIKALNESDTLVMIFDDNFPPQEAKTQMSALLKFLQDPDAYNQTEGENKKTMTELTNAQPGGNVPDLPAEASETSEAQPEFQGESYNASGSVNPGEQDVPPGEVDATMAPDKTDPDLHIQQEQEITPPVMEEEGRPTQRYEQASMDSGLGFSPFAHDFVDDWMAAAENWETKEEAKFEAASDEGQLIPDDALTDNEVEELAEKIEPEQVEAIKSEWVEENLEQGTISESDQTWQALDLLSDTVFPWEEESIDLKEAQMESPNAAQEKMADDVRGTGDRLEDMEQPAETLPADLSLAAFLQESDLAESNPLPPDWAGAQGTLPEDEAAIPEPNARQESAETAITQESGGIQADTLGITPPRGIPSAQTAPPPGFSAFSAGTISLSYTFILIPRFPKQYLAGKLAKAMGEWLPKLCISYGWRLEKLTVRPNYTQCTISASPRISPNKVIQRLRSATSTRIQKDWPDLFLDNPSNDFWAPGYLLTNGNVLLSTEIITDYINNTRHFQGISPL